MACRYRKSDWFDVVVGALVLAVIVISAVAIAIRVSHDGDCHARGGDVVEHDCRWILVGKTMVRSCERSCTEAE